MNTFPITSSSSTEKGRSSRSKSMMKKFSTKRGLLKVSSQFMYTDIYVQKEETELKYKQFNRNQSRALEFISLSVIIVININAYASKIFLLVVFLIALLLFLLFNVMRIKQEKSALRYLFYIPILVLYVPFYLNKSLDS